MENLSVSLLVQKIGPYHHARFKAAAERGPLSVLEYRADDMVYAWAKVGTDPDYYRVTVEAESVVSALEATKPDVIVCVGYSDPEIHQAMGWALAHDVPMVICSDSTYADESRVSWREAFKRKIVAPFQAGIISGRRASQYMQYLGLNERSLFRAWDVVDNDYFASGASAIKDDAARWRSRHGLPAQYFLCVSRFVTKKNLSTLLEAYRQYVTACSGWPWALVLCGDGPLEAELRAQVAASRLGDKVQFTGFKQYDELPIYYGLAQVFILPSLSDQWGLVVNEAMASGLPVLVSDRCGCADDLVEAGINGDTFDALRTDEIAYLLTKYSSLSTKKLRVMGQHSTELVAKYSLETFAKGLWAAASWAKANQAVKPGWLSRMLIAGLGRIAQR